MKTLKLTLIAFAFLTLLFSFNIDAKDAALKDSAIAPIEVSLILNRDDYFKVYTVNPDTVIYKVRILDLNGRILYSKKIKNSKKSFIKYDINELPVGTYVYEVTSNVSTPIVKEFKRF